MFQIYDTKNNHFSTISHIEFFANKSKGIYGEFKIIVDKKRIIYCSMNQGLTRYLFCRSSMATKNSDHLHIRKFKKFDYGILDDYLF